MDLNVCTLVGLRYHTFSTHPLYPYISYFHGHSSISGLISHNCLDGVIGLGLVSLVGLVSLSGINGLIRQISHISLTGISGFGLLGGFGLFSLISFSGLIGSNGLVGLNSLVAAIIAAADFLVAKAMQEAAAKTHGVAIKLASATKITNATIWYYCAALLVQLSFICEGELVVTCAFYCRLDSLFSLFFGDALQNAKQLFSTRLPQMTKYCVMRECENIH
jgi:hypothetical protein